MSQVAIIARVTVKEGKTEQYVAAFTPLLEQARKEPGTLLYALHRSKDDPDVFWTTEIYADDAAFAVHAASDVHAAASPVFTELIAGADVISGETLMAKGLGGLSGSCTGWLPFRKVKLSGARQQRQHMPRPCISIHRALHRSRDQRSTSPSRAAAPCVPGIYETCTFRGVGTYATTRRRFAVARFSPGPGMLGTWKLAGARTKACS